MSGIFGSNNQTVTQRTQLPDWINSFAQDTLGMAGTAAEELTPPYQGERIAPINELQGQTLEAAGNNIGSTDPYFQNALGGAGQVMGYTPNQVNAPSFLQGNIDQYMSPYVANVEQQAIRQLDEQRQRALNQTADQARSAGAFGGSRHGVMEGVTNTEAAKQAGMLSAQLRDQAYNQGRAAMESDFGRQMQSQLANQAAGLQGSGLNLQAAGTYGDLARVGQDSFLKGLGAAQGAGNFLQQYDQLGLDTDMQKYAELRGYPLEQLDVRLNALGMTPYGQTSATTTPMSSNGLMTGLGGALAGAQLAPMLGFGAGAGAGVGGALGLASMFLSDEREKTNKQKLGKDAFTGLDIYAYDYKDDVKAAKKAKRPMGPKRIGPMAQDIEKKYPGAVTEMGGKKVVNLGFGGAHV